MMRRGNTLVLVTAILVLLAIIAVAYLSRTQAGRSTSAAQQLANSRTVRIDAVADNLAQIIGESLFTRPADPADPWLTIPPNGGTQMPTPSPSRPRGAVDPNAHRYNIDALDLFNSVTDTNLDGLLDAAAGADGIPEGYNYAPYVVQPWTNWPDVFGVFPGDGNPAGNPSYGDSRWLRSLEPLRQLIAPTAANPPIPNGSPFGNFTHWHHLTWLPTADNGWRLITDLKDIDISVASSIALAPQQLSFPLTGQAGWAVDMPYEQWLPDVVPNGAYLQHLNGSNGSLALAQQFRTHAQNWFSNYYNLVGANPASGADPLPNFMRLASFGPPTDELVNGSARQLITRTLADADGDGFTDSYWFLAPTSSDRGVRQAVAVSITDNSGRINANVATRFDRRTTIGTTPADVALATSFDLVGGNLWDFDLPVGFLTDPVNAPEGALWSGAGAMTYPPSRVRYDEAMYGAATNAGSPGSAASLVLTGNADNPTYLRALGAVRSTNATTSGLLDAFRYQLRDGNERVRWFKAMGQDGEINSWINSDDSAAGGPSAAVFLRGQSGQPPARLRPFDESDEVELRMREACNNASVLSRFERAIQQTDALGVGDFDPASSFEFLRASGDRLETMDAMDWQASGAGGQWERFRRLNAYQLLRDNRRKVTMFSGARNELLPPWLWTVPRGNYSFTAGSWGYFAGCGPTQVWPAPAQLPNASAQASVGFQPNNGYSREDFLVWNRKVDLRRAAVQPWYDASWTLGNGQALLTDRWTFLNQVSRVLERGLLDPAADPSLATPPPRATYFGIQQGTGDEVLTTRRLVASWAANIECFRDPPKVQVDGSFIDHTFHPNEAYTISEDNGGSEPRAYIGYEKQPFIQEVFFALVYPKSKVPPGWPTAGQETIPGGYPGGGEQFVTYQPGGADDQQPAIVMAVQIANPHHEPIPLGNYAIRAFGQTFRFGQLASTNWGYGMNPLLGPATETAPRSAIVLCCPKDFGGDSAFRAKWIDFLDITHDWMRNPGSAAGHPYPANFAAEMAGASASGFAPWPLQPDNTGTDLFEDVSTVYPDSMVFNATKETGNTFGRWDDGASTSGVAVYRNFLENTQNPTVELLRTTVPLNPVNGIAEVVVDRIENEFNSDSGDFRDALERLFSTDAGAPHAPPAPTTYDPAADPSVGGTQQPTFDCVRLGGSGDFFCTWVRVARPWAFDTDLDGAFEISERAPRFVVADGQRPIKVTTEQRASEGGNPAATRTGSIWSDDEDPDGGPALNQPAPWFTANARDIFGRIVRGKPTRFNGQSVFQGATGTDRLYPAFVYPASNAWGDYPTATSGGHGGIVTQPGDKGIEVDTKYLLTSGQSGEELEVWRGSLDMSWKDRDFDQIAEVANVFQWGPVMSGAQTYATFAEIMSGEVDDYPIIKGRWLERDAQGNTIADPSDPTGLLYTATDGTLANRLSFPYDELNSDQRDAHNFDPTKTRTMLKSVAAFLPALPAGCTIFDGFTLDDRGAAYVAGSYAELQQGASTQAQRDQSQARAEDRRFRLAMGYRAQSTPGLINLNTALLETMSAMPYMRALPIDETAPGPMWSGSGAAGPFASVGVGGYLPAWTKFVRVPSSILMYRDLRGGSFAYNPTNTNAPPFYTDRGLVPDQIPNTPGMWPGMRRGQGVWSLGELALLTRTVGQNTAGGYLSSGRNWSIQYAGLDPYGWNGIPDSDIGWYSGANLDARLPLDRTPAIIQSDIPVTAAVEPTVVSADGEVGTAEELNMLFGGIGNIASVRSDYFTVHFLVRTIRPHPKTGRWDGTDAESVIDESRYVMLVDRTPVDSPGQKPRIRYFTKVP